MFKIIYFKKIKKIFEPSDWPSPKAGWLIQVRSYWVGLNWTNSIFYSNFFNLAHIFFLDYQTDLLGSAYFDNSIYCNTKGDILVCFARNTLL